jgi:hypothetical protein
MMMILRQSSNGKTTKNKAIQKLPKTKTFFCVETTRLEHEQLKTIKQNQKCFRFVRLSDRSLRHCHWPSSVTCIIIAHHHTATADGAIARRGGGARPSL